MRTAIIDAAKKLLWETGYESMSPRKVLDASGAGQGSLYHHFRTKRQLAAAALAEVEAELLSTAETIFAPDRPPMERLRAYLLLDRDGRKGCRLGRLGNESEVLGIAELRAPLASYFAKIEGWVRDAVVQAQNTGELNPGLHADRVAAAIVATVQGGFLLSRVQDDPDAISRATSGAWSILEANSSM